MLGILSKLAEWCGLWLQKCHKFNVDTSRMGRNNNAAMDFVIGKEKGKIEIIFTRSVGEVTVLWQNACPFARELGI